MASGEIPLTPERCLHRRVRSVFSGFPVYVPPLSREQMLEAIEKRYHLLAAQPDRFIQPVDQTLLDYLYDLYEGKVRFVMDAVTSIVTNMPYMFSETLDAGAAKSFLAGTPSGVLSGERGCADHPRLSRRGAAGPVRLIRRVPIAGHGARRHDERVHPPSRVSFPVPVLARRLHPRQRIIANAAAGVGCSALLGRMG